MDLWGEIKFWFDRYRTWVLVGLGFIVLTMAFLLISRFSTDSNRQMARQAEEVVQTQQVIQEQQEELLGESNFSQAVQDIPTENELMDYVDSQTEGEVNSYTSQRVYDLIEGEFGETVRILAENGYILSDVMTADQRTIIQLYQEQVLWLNGDVSQEDLVSLTIDEYGVGIPKTSFNVRKYLGQQLSINNYKYTVMDAEEKEVPENAIYVYDSGYGDITMSYNIEETVNVGKVDIIGGFVLKADKDVVDINVTMAYLIYQPKDNMTGQEFIEELDNMEITVNGVEVSNKKYNPDGLVEQTPHILTVQMVDATYEFWDESEQDVFSEIKLEVNGKEVPLTVSGLDFVQEIDK